MIYTTREQCKEKILEVTNFAIENDLSVAIIFHKNFVSGIEYRVMYAENYNECNLWLDHVTSFLKNLSKPLPYVAYINGEMKKSMGDIFA